MQELVDLLVRRLRMKLEDFADNLQQVSENPGVQSSVKDSLGSVFGVDAFPILFKQLHSIISRFIESDDTSSSADTSSIFSHFIGEALSLLSLQSDRLSGDLLKATSNLLDDLILACTRFVSRMGRSAAAARLKVDITRISASVLAGRSGRSDRDDLVFRNHLLEHVVNWYGQSVSVFLSVGSRCRRRNRLAEIGCCRRISTKCRRIFTRCVGTDTGRPLRDQLTRMDRLKDAGIELSSVQSVLRLLPNFATIFPSQYFTASLRTSTDAAKSQMINQASRVSRKVYIA